MKRTFKTEAELCDAFMVSARSAGWTVYPETCGWDMLLVGADGVQVGVEAKLHGNVRVLAQALDRGDWYGAGADYHAVLVPDANNDFCAVARRCGVVVISQDYYGRLELDLEHEKKWEHETRHALPAFVPDVPAGVPCPVRLTLWKISAIKICNTLRTRGYLTRDDFRAEKVSPTFWVDRLIVDSGERETNPATGRKLTRYVHKPGARLPDEDHPEIAAKLAAVPA